MCKENLYGELGQLPISGDEERCLEAISRGAKSELYRGHPSIDFGSVKSACAVALHMHQPLIPAGGSHNLQEAQIISNLKDMMDNPSIGDNHNAHVFHDCYRRLGYIIPELLEQGHQPRVMLEYSGTLLYGLGAMGLHDVADTLRRITCDTDMRHTTEWLGCPWGHAVAPSTPVQDFRLHVKAWQQYFAALFGYEALERVRGFSPSEMALPNHPDVAYEFVKILKDCGFQWVLVQEHTVERPENGHGPEQRHIPHRLVCQNSAGESVSIVAIIKTQGSDTKLVAQMQPYFEACGLGRQKLAGKDVPQLVTQIADGENGGVMMNEFPPKFREVAALASKSQTPLMNGSEYLEHLWGLGLKEEDLPALQPIKQYAIWQNFKAGDGTEKLEKVIEKLKKEDHNFHMEGGSWTNNISWVKGYEDVLGPMEQASAAFNEHILQAKVATTDPRFREALFYLMCSQTSCYRYWGQGVWTDYGKELCRRASEFAKNK